MTVVKDRKHSVNIDSTTLIDLHRIGFKFVPLSEDGKTPNVYGLLTPEERQRSIEESADGKVHPVNYVMNYTSITPEKFHDGYVALVEVNY